MKACRWVDTAEAAGLTPVCANDLEEAGLGLLASDDLRVGRLAPVVPLRSHLAQSLDSMNEQVVVHLC